MKHLSNQTTNIQVVRVASYGVLVREYYIEQKSLRFLSEMVLAPSLDLIKMVYGCPYTYCAFRQDSSCS